MSFYIKSLFVAVPIFMFLIALEALVAKKRGLVVNRQADVITSLSSGLTKMIRDGIRYGFAIIGYSWLVKNLTVFHIENTWIAVIIAFLVQDFTGYCTHRLKHRVNILWNRHVIHHSSEDFNLACALRQSISNAINFSTIFMIPAALLGVPVKIFIILGPIHFFFQFWYHTQLIGKMGVFEYFLVTPSHHRVHHAINPEYIDKNYGQILIIWDKLFGTFQAETENVKPVYGTLKPVRTWNPVVINFKHFWQLLKDAWHAESYFDKIRIWFMPTGWRPIDVKEKFPLLELTNPAKQSKYNTNNSRSLFAYAWAQLVITHLLLLHLLIIFSSHSNTMNYLYAVVLLLSVFSFTSMLDHSNYSFIAELLKLILVFVLLFIQNFSWYGLQGIPVYLLITYIIFSLVLTFYFQKNEKSNKIVNPSPV
ncbi:MAG: sterol desaturase family protein [Candidatus Neomarinimicrobiota bacterium]|nr:MAG: sterol desaturase family protein [bacterium]|tara:strand:+ start:194 stop:1459 length:1266 start_codon:yes stop_codon:yes gene_type:complete